MNPLTLIAGEVEGLDPPGNFTRILLSFGPFGASETSAKSFEEQSDVLVEPVVVDHGAHGRITTAHAKMEVALLNREIGRTRAASQWQGQASAIESAGLSDPQPSGSVEGQQGTRGVECVPTAGPPRTASSHIIQHRDIRGLRSASHPRDARDSGRVL